jgi:epoxyqueuosine reductase
MQAASERLSTYRQFCFKGSLFRVSKASGRSWTPCLPMAYSCPREAIRLKLEEEIRQFLIDRGALKVGFATLETLEGGPPSADLTYIIPEARSAVSFALPLDKDKIRSFLGKEDHTGHEQDNFDTNVKSSRLAKALALRLQEEGFASKRVISNTIYRTEIEGWELSMPPDLSHRYVAARSGVGSFGWSGNIGIKGYGSAILLGTTVTAAVLEPTPPEAPEDSFCDNCRRCVAVCASGMFSADEEMSVTLGGETFTFAARDSYLGCQFVCGGFTGLSRDGKWSTWSPGRFSVPEDPGEMTKVFLEAVGKYSRWPERTDGEGGYVNPALAEENLRLTCANCQLICWGDHKQTRENYRLLKRSGCVIQRENGDIEVLPAREAAKAFAGLPPEHRKLYTDTE